MKFLPLLFVPLIASCGLAAGTEAPRSERAQTRLTRALEGKVAGPPQRCISPFARNEQEIVDQRTILFKNGRNLVYRNDPEGGCQGLDQSRAIIVTSISGDYCRGDIIRVLDQTSGNLVGSCAFSDFIPYTAPANPAEPVRNTP